jgi:hypothetical protein
MRPKVADPGDQVCDEEQSKADPADCQRSFIQGEQVLSLRADAASHGQPP